MLTSDQKKIVQLFKNLADDHNKLTKEYGQLVDENCENIEVLIIFLKGVSDFAKSYPKQYKNLNKLLDKHFLESELKTESTSFIEYVLNNDSSKDNLLKNINYFDGIIFN